MYGASLKIWNIKDDLPTPCSLFSNRACCLFNIRCSVCAHYKKKNSARKDGRCIQFIKNSKVIFILRGLPGSGKSTVAKQIKQVYGDLALICSADDFRMTDSGEYFWKPEEYDMSHLKCEEKARQACYNERPVVIIDDTNIRKELLYWYIDAARSYDYFVVLVEPKTTWRYSISDLILKTHHQVSKEILEEMWSTFDQIIAKYYGWFLSENGVQTLKDRMFEMIDECCETITPSFKDDFQKLDNGQDGKESGDLTSQHTSSDTILSTLPCLEYIQDKLHVTAFYNKREQANEAHEYVSSSAVRDALGSVGRMVIIAWTITPRTITARVKLNSQQIELYDHQDYLSHEELSASSQTCPQTSDYSTRPLAYTDLILKPTLGKGDTAHITLSRRSDVTAVRGRFDLRDLIGLELANKGYEEHRLSQGVARRYNDGIWAVYLDEPVIVDVLFTGYY